MRGTHTWDLEGDSMGQPAAASCFSSQKTGQPSRGTRRQTLQPPIAGWAPAKGALAEGQGQIPLHGCRPLWPADGPQAGRFADLLPACCPGIPG